MLTKTRESRAADATQHSPLLAAIVCALSLAVAIDVGAQSRPDTGSSREVRGCYALTCEDEHLLTLALDAVLRESRECRDDAPFVLNTLHLAPHSGDVVPRSPVVLRAEDLSPALFARYWPAIRIVDTVAARSLPMPRGRCLLIFSPPVARAGGDVRVEVAIRTEHPKQHIQRFVVIRRIENEWVVQRVETGRIS